jgi:hypothetical protein
LRKIILLSLALLSTPAFAQQSDPAFLNRAIAVLQAQRNQALDSVAAERARADGLSDDLAKAQARIRELEPKPEAKAPPPNNDGH